MHIGKYLPPAKGGMENSIINICRTLSEKNGIEVVLVGTNGIGLPVEHHEKFKIKSLRTWWTLASTPIVTGLYKIIKIEKPDIIHVHLPNPWITLLLSLVKTPVIATYHCDIVSFNILKKFYAPILKFFLNRCLKVITTSPQLTKSSELTLYQEKLKVISLSVPPLSLQNENLELTQQLRMISNNIILFVGRLVPYKGLKFLIEAMIEIDGHLIIVGDGAIKKNLLELVKNKNLTAKITFSGSVSDEDLPSYYNAAKVVALPSINEGEALGICLIEALSLGRPLVTTDLMTGVSYVNQDKETGFVVPPMNSSALAKAIKIILQNPETWDKFSKNAKIRYGNIFDLNKIGEQYYDTYKEVLKL